MVQGGAIRAALGNAVTVPSYTSADSNRASNAKILSTLVVVAGVFAGFSIAWPVNWGWELGTRVWWLQWVAISGLFYAVLRASTPRRAAGVGWAFATAWLISVFWWLFVAMHTYGGLSGVLAGAAVVALAATLALYYGAACYGFARWVNPLSPVAPVVFAIFWTLAELARATWFTGFGWGALGYAHSSGPLRNLAPFVGVFGVGLASVWIACSVVQAAYLRRLRRLLPVAAVLCALSIVPNPDFTQSSGAIPVVLLQGNIPQDEKFEAGSGIPLALAWYQAQWGAPDKALFVAPETAIPLLPNDLPTGYLDRVYQRFSDDQSALLTGIPLGDFQTGYRNGVIGLSGVNQPVYQYAKHHLVPFGEFIPPMFKWFTQLMHIPLGDFERGGIGQPSFLWHGQRLAPNICYEDLYGNELAQRFIRDDGAPTILVNMSNLGWFGDTVAIQQHQAISTMRALEFQRPFVRATNTGATQILDYRGQVMQSLQPLTRGALRGEVEGRTGITPYAWWLARFGLWPLWLIGIVAMAYVTRMGRDQPARDPMALGH